MHVEGKGCSKVYTFITIRQILQIRQLTVRQTPVSPLYRFQLVKVGLSSGVWSYSDESSRFFQFFRKIQRLLFKKYPLKFSKLKNQGPFILNEAMPDLMVAFLGWNSNFEKKVRGAYYQHKKQLRAAGENTRQAHT